MGAADHVFAPFRGVVERAAGGVAISRALLARQAERLGHRPAEQRIAERGEHQPQGGLVDRPVLVALAELVDEAVDRVEDRVERVAIAGEDHPGGERAGALAVERVEGAVDDLARIGLALARRARTASAMPAVTRSPISRASSACSPAAEPKWWSRLAWVLPISAADRLQGHRLRPRLDQQRARRLQRGGAAFLGGQAFARY